MNKLTPVSSLLIILLLFLIPAVIWSQEGIGGYIGKALPGDYAEIENELLQIFKDGRAAGVPAKLLTEPVLEGIAKKVPPARLLSAVEFLKERYTTLSSLLKHHTLLPDEEDLLIETLTRLHIYWNTGINEEVIAMAAESTASVPVLLSVTETLSKIEQVYPLSLSTQRELTQALLDSRFPPSHYSSIAAVFTRGRSRGLTGQEIGSIIIQTLNRGGGMIQIDENIRKRSVR